MSRNVGEGFVRVGRRLLLKGITLIEKKRLGKSQFVPR